MHSADINEHVREVTRGDFTAKDFRTWNATVLMAQLLALENPATTQTARKRAVARSYERVADYLGNTPAVARGSYVDPRVVDLYDDGVVLPAGSLPKDRKYLPCTGGSSERSCGCCVDRPVDLDCLEPPGFPQEPELPDHSAELVALLGRPDDRAVATAESAPPVRRTGRRTSRGRRVDDAGVLHGAVVLGRRTHDEARIVRRAVRRRRTPGRGRTGRPAPRSTRSVDRVSGDAA